MRKDFPVGKTKPFSLKQAVQIRNQGSLLLSIITDKLKWSFTAMTAADSSAYPTTNFWISWSGRRWLFCSIFNMQPYDFICSLIQVLKQTTLSALQEEREIQSKIIGMPQLWENSDFKQSLTLDSSLLKISRSWLQDCLAEDLWRSSSLKLLQVLIATWYPLTNIWRELGF